MLSRRTTMRNATTSTISSSCSFSLSSSSSSSVFLSSLNSVVLFSTYRTVMSRTSQTQKSYRNLLPRNYFVGGKSPKSVPKQSSSSGTLVNSTAPFANAGLITTWREEVRKEFVELVSAPASTARTKVSFASSSSSPSKATTDNTSPEKNNPEKNTAVLLPAAGSTKEGKFKCSKCDGVWFARIRERNDPQQDTGCPHCIRKNKEEMILELAAPQIASEWDIARNKMFSTLTPSTTPVTSKAHLWWICNLCAGSFNSCVKDRVEGTAHCPTCVEAKLDPTLNSKSASLRNQMLKKETQKKRFVVDSRDDEESSSFNSSIKNPLNKFDNVRSEVLAPWTCSKCGCSWKGSSFHQRLEQHTLCPSCSGQVATSANSLAINRPDVVRAIAKHEKQILSPGNLEQLTTYSQTLVWFRCFSCRKEYRMSIRQRCQYASEMKDGRTFGQSVDHNQSSMNPCPHCQRTRRVIALENSDRGNVDGYVSAKKASLHIQQHHQHSGREKVAPPSRQNIASRSLNGPN